MRAIGAYSFAPDGTQLAFSNGQTSEPHLLLVTVADGQAKDAGIGYDPAWQPSDIP